MDETPSDSGDSPVDENGPVEPPQPIEFVEASPVIPEASWRSIDWAEQIRRPAIWGLLLLIAVVLAVQVWLLYL